VLRSYDNRFRRTTRTAQIYLDKECEDIIGGKAKEVVKTVENSNAFWKYGEGEGEGDGELLIIATPYRRGDHKAKSPASFVGVIEDLERLHKRGYVHGDIRGFNIVFGEDRSCLIDFDFGGKEDRVPVVKYPKGYRRTLVDGVRIGKGEQEILKWHDWYALGNLIFNPSYHTFSRPSDAESRLQYLDLQDFWTGSDCRHSLNMHTV
jgi:hypothetical protein